MTNASTNDAKIGFDIYRASGGSITLEGLNEKIVDDGGSPISKRTFIHYRRLMKAGLTQYMPINRFDVARTSGTIRE